MCRAAAEQTKFCNCFVDERYVNINMKNIDLSPNDNYLMSYTWPGNVRELENVIQRALVLCSEKTIHTTDIITDVKLNQCSAKELMESSLSIQL